MADIVTDVNVLHETSKSVEIDKIGEIISQLKESISADSLGLAAIQIGIPKRIFLANLSSGPYFFVNPEITWRSADKVPSVEGCLSIPGCIRCIERHSQIEITHSGSDCIDGVSVSRRFKNQDAYIIQHEYDHLNGMLIIDRTEVKTFEQKASERDQKRKQKVAISRSVKLKKSQPQIRSKKISVKQAQKKKRADRTARKQAKMRVEIEERYKADQKNLFNDQPNTA